MCDMKKQEMEWAKEVTGFCWGSASLLFVYDPGFVQVRALGCCSGWYTRQVGLLQRGCKAGRRITGREGKEVGRQDGLKERYKKVDIGWGPRHVTGPLSERENYQQERRMTNGIKE
eukprot:TRINITY_DN139_c0_g1_i4.p2 TRINITY_DN139_c0_g1~~TRINITY_DN139_c0_g1_i4.p2  ORF type:complete len:116 (-),score=6.96 TRINITY_DN139_c0_g1_i4:1044-1391(-)